MAGKGHDVDDFWLGSGLSLQEACFHRSNEGLSCGIFWSGAITMNERILIIEDDQQILKLLQRGLPMKATPWTLPPTGAWG
jgi:hypothetical protein